MDALERFRQLAAWLADSDIALLELRGPQTLLRLARHGAGSGDVADGQTRHEVAASRSQARPGTTIVPASTVGIVRHRHPLRDGPLAPPGARIECGQTLALLQIGQILVQVPAPRDGIVANMLAQDGDAVGYGDPLIELLD
jgi:acetyl-CoA carboxylase biotin carboxyl carrier protein